MGEHENHHGPLHYVKIWALLLVLLVISIVGPMFEIQWLTLITAFGIAGVKAYIVAAYFMHLKIEKRFITYILLVMTALLLVFVSGTMVDIMKPNGAGWEKLQLDVTAPKAGEVTESHGEDEH